MTRTLKLESSMATFSLTGSDTGLADVASQLAMSCLYNHNGANRNQ
jgi:hypothetical protein